MLLGLWCWINRKRDSRELDGELARIEPDSPYRLAIGSSTLREEFGRRIADGAPQAVLRNPDVIAAYLGEAISDAA